MDNFLQFNSDGLLEAGIHKMSLEDFKIRFVSSFSYSKTRSRIYNNLVSWCKDLVKNYHIYEIWIDGSYVTEKINPNDVDCVVFFYADGYLKAAPIWSTLRNKADIDGYFSLAICHENERVVPPKEYATFVNRRNYWRGQFGFDRLDRPKGIIAIDPGQFSNGGI